MLEIDRSSLSLCVSDTYPCLIVRGGARDTLFLHRASRGSKALGRRETCIRSPTHHLITASCICSAVRCREWSVVLKGIYLVKLTLGSLLDFHGRCEMQISGSRFMLHACMSMSKCGGSTVWWCFWSAGRELIR